MNAATEPAEPDTGNQSSEDLVSWIDRYTELYRMALVEIPPGHKGPLREGWNEAYVTDAGAAQKHWAKLPKHGVGAVLGPSGLCSCDIDLPEHAELILGVLGLDLAALRAAGTPTIQGNPARYRLMFKAPPGVVLGRKVLFWPARVVGEKPLTVFELRAGPVQDVLPPTIHPDTRKPYVWLTPPNSEFPPLPGAVLELWQNWDSYKKELEGMCPWGKGFSPDIAPRGNGARPNVIAAFNEAHTVEDLLAKHGYKRKGASRWLSPTSSTGLAGVKILDGRVFSHHGSDPLAGDHTRDAFDVYRILEHGGDTKAAVKAAATALGIGASEPGGQGPRVDARGALASDVEGADHHVNQPIPDPDMLYGLAGEVGRIAAETTEANEYAVAAGFMTFLSANVGRDVYLPVGNTWHHAILFELHVGRSGRGRKGDALSLPQRIRHAIQEFAELLLGQTHIGGLSTREGLALLIHDGFMNGKVEVPPIDDKRLWVVESEFSNILHQGKRDGNTLSSALRDAWDGVSIRPAIKSARVWASNPHIALSGAITPSELLNVIERRELTNGFASRILIFWSERKRLEDDPTATPPETVRALAVRAAKIIEFARGDYPMMKDTRAMRLDDDARTLYKRLYRGELNRHTDGEILMALLERRAPMLLRLAMLFALTDLTLVISTRHIKAALAWVRYWSDSVRFIFSGMADTEGATERGELGEQIIGFLKKQGEVDRWEIVRDCFSGHMSATKIDGALDDLLAETPPRIEMVLVPRRDGQPGRGRKLYRFLNSAREDSEDSEDRRRIRAELTSHGCEDSEDSFPSPDLTSQTSHGCEDRKTQAQCLSSQTSLTSHGSIKNTDTDPLPDSQPEGDGATSWILTCRDGTKKQRNCTIPVTRARVLEKHPEAIEAQSLESALADVRAWLQRIGETQTTIDEVLELCVRDDRTLVGYLGSVGQAEDEELGTACPPDAKGASSEDHGGHDVEVGV